MTYCFFPYCVAEVCLQPASLALHSPAQSDLLTGDAKKVKEQASPSSLYEVGSTRTEEALKALVRGDTIVGVPCRRRSGMKGVAGLSDTFHLLKAQLLALKGPLKGHGLFKTRSCTVSVWTYCLTLPCTSDMQTSRMQSGWLCGSLVRSPEHSMEQKPHVQTGVVDACLVTQSFLMKVKEITIDSVSEGQQKESCLFSSSENVNIHSSHW